MTKEYSDYLAHHGIKGQKWGVRRFQNEDGTLKNPKNKKKQKPESSTWKAEDADKLSNEELDRRNQRLQKENAYRQNVQNAHPGNRELKNAIKKVLVYSAVTALSAIMVKKYQAGADFIATKAKKAYNFVKQNSMKIDLSKLR